MTKLKFLLSLHERLSSFPRDEVEERLHFYSEMIEDRMEEGLSEEDAVSAVGSIDEIAKQITNEIFDSHIPMEVLKSKRKPRTREIVLLVLSFPITLPLLLAGSAVMISLYITMWAVIISLWATLGSVAGCTFSGILLGIGFMVSGNGLPGAGLIAAGIVCAGLTILLFYGCKAATKGVVFLTKKIFKSIMKRFLRKENVS